jgi:transposase
MKAYSQDLRERIIRALQEQQETQPEIAARFSVSLSFVEKLWLRWRISDECAARAHAGGRRRSLRVAETFIRREVADQPDVTLSELCQRVAAQGAPSVSSKTMCLELKRLTLPRKKVAPPQRAGHGACRRLAHQLAREGRRVHHLAPEVH